MAWKRWANVSVNLSTRLSFRSPLARHVAPLAPSVPESHRPPPLSRLDPPKKTPPPSCPLLSTPPPDNSAFFQLKPLHSICPPPTTPFLLAYPSQSAPRPPHFSHRLLSPPQSLSCTLTNLITRSPPKLAPSFILSGAPFFLPVSLLEVNTHLIRCQPHLPLGAPDFQTLCMYTRA